MKTIDEPMPICEAEMERLKTIGGGLQIAGHGGAYAISCRSHSRNGWMSWPMNRREMTIHRQNADCPETVREHLPSPCSRPWRCVTLLVSIIVDERRSSRDFLMGFMANPTLPATRVIWRNPSTDRSVTHQRKTRHETLRQRRQHDVRHHRDGPRTVSCAAIGHHQLCAVVDGR